jgi:hypothetical protein
VKAKPGTVEIRAGGIFGGHFVIDEHGATEVHREDDPRECAICIRRFGHAALSEQPPRQLEAQA